MKVDEEMAVSGATVPGTAASPYPRWQRGALTAFVARHRRAWDGTMTALALLYLVVAVRADEAPTSVPALVLLVLSAMFVVEFALRCWDAPSRPAYVRAHWIDAVSCIPLIGGLRVIRVLRLLRVGSGIRALANVEHEVARRGRDRQSFWFVAPCLVVLWAGSAYGIWVLEHGRNPGIKSFGDALYWSVTTVTTIGYGDIRPVTVAGRMLAGALAFLGLGLLGFASARLTALWLQPTQREDVVASAALAAHLEALHGEVADLRRSLAQHGIRPVDAPAAKPHVNDETPTPTASETARSVADWSV